MPKPNKEQYFFSNQKYICFLTTVLNIIHDSQIPKFSSVYSKRRYNQHQLLALLILKEYLNFGYRGLTEIIQLMDIIREQ